MKNFWIIAVIMASILPACAGETLTTRSIKNSSSDTLRYQLYRLGGVLTDTLTLLPDERRDISRGTSSGSEENAPNCADLIDSAYFEVLGGGTLNKPIQLNQNWEMESEQTKTFPPEYEHTCIFSISDSDISE